MEAEGVIELRNVCKSYRGSGGDPVRAVDGVSLRVAAAETLCLIGTSGCGKTTVLKTINRLIAPTEGSVWVDGEDVAAADPIRLRRKIGYVVQRGGLFPHMTVARNVGLLCELEGWKPARRTDRVLELLRLANLDPDRFADRYPSELSGGQRQRVTVARALALNPRFVLLDEPFGALDPITRRQIQGEFKALQAELGKTMVVVTHDLSEAFSLGDRVALMNGGKVIQIGNESDFRNKPVDDFVRAFIGGHS